MENKQISSMGDLRSEILRLKAEVQLREVSIQQDIQHISDQIKAPFEFLKKIGLWFGKTEGGEKAHADWVGTIAQLGIPYLLNSLFFKRSGLIMKALVALVSQKAVQGLNLETITHWIKQASDWIKKQKQEKRATKNPTEEESPLGI